MIMQKKYCHRTLFTLLALLQTEICYYVKMLFIVFNLCPKFPSEELFGLQDVEYKRSHKFTDVKGL